MLPLTERGISAAMASGPDVCRGPPSVVPAFRETLLRPPGSTMWAQRKSSAALYLDVDADRDHVCSERNLGGGRRLRWVMLAPPPIRLLLAPRHPINRVE